MGPPATCLGFQCLALASSPPLPPPVACLVVLPVAMLLVKAAAIASSAASWFLLSPVLARLRPSGPLVSWPSSLR